MAAPRSCRRKTVAARPLIHALASAPTFHALASAATLLLTLLPSTLRAQSTNEPPPFLRTGPSLTQAPEGATPFVKNRWMDRNGDGWDDLWLLISNMAAPKGKDLDKAQDTDGDGVSDYDEMLHWRDPRVKGPPLGWPNYTVEELLQAQIAAEAMRRTNEAAMARRREVLRQFAAGPIGKGTRGPLAVRSVADLQRARETHTRGQWQAGKAKRDANLEKARAHLRTKGIPEIMKGTQGNPTIFSGADKNGKPRFYITHNVTSAKSIQTDKLTLPVVSAGFGLTGNGVIIGHWDGADAQFNHQDLGTARVTDQDTTGGDLNANTASRSHATHTAGTLVGLGLNGAVGGFAAGDALGMASGATVKSWEYNLDLLEMNDHFTLVAPASRVVVSNHSYGSPVGWDGNLNNIPIWNRPVDTGLPENDSFIEFGEYNTTSAELDEHIFNSWYHLPVYSAGNHRGQVGSPLPSTQFYLRDANGIKLFTRTQIVPTSGPAYYLWKAPDDTIYESVDDPPPPPDGAATGGYRTIGPEVTAYNVLSVGSCADLPNGYQGPESVNISSFSSWGPTEHGLIKPDVVANGESLLSAVFDSSGTATYSDLTGTSMAAPSVTGTLGLLMQHYRNRYGTEARLWSSTLKALIIHTVDQVDSDNEPTTYYDGPDYRGGWGLVNGKRAADMITLDGAPGSQGAPRHSLIREILYDVIEWPDMTLPATAIGGEPLIVTWTWMDPAFATEGAYHSNLFIITVEDSGGNFFHEWILDPDNASEPAEQRARVFGDPLDVVHQVLIPNPVAGETYTVHVAGCCWTEENHNFSNYAPVSVIMSGVQPVVPDLKITNIERVSATGVVSLGWQSNPGEIYRIETSTDLINWTRAKDPDELDLPDVVPQGMFSTVEVNEEVAGETRRFWRVKALHPWQAVP